MTEERKFAILFAATLLCARKLAELDSDKPSPAKIYAVNTAIEKAAFIMDRMGEKWPQRCGIGTMSNLTGNATYQAL
jgi:hypothetical protein